MDELQPLVLCMENAAGEEVTLSVDHTDDFHTFLEKAKSVLGYEIDLTSLTKNQPVNLNDNAYQFLMNLEIKDELEQADTSEDQLYVLDDGTQIRASQIHFDNEDDPLDITLEKLPFIQINDFEEPNETADLFDSVDYKIVASPVPSLNNSLNHDFINTIPFKLVYNNASGFEAQFTKYIEKSAKSYVSNVNKMKSPRSLIKDNFNDKDFRYTREEILNILKDSPVTSIPYEVSDKKHVRKTDPTRMVQKSSSKLIDIESLIIRDGGKKNCFICEMNVSDTIYLFDKEDQKQQRQSQKKTTQLKMICEKCLNEYFVPSRMKCPSQYLNSDEYLVIKNNQQYIFQKIKHLEFPSEQNTKIKTDEFVKVEIGSDGEIVTKPVDKDFVDEQKDNSDVEIVEESDIDKIVDNFEEADEEVKTFLGIYECKSLEVKELKCRFCELTFAAIPEVMEHCETHKHVLEDDIVFPCPLCDYGYPTLKWLKGHVKAVHENSTKDTNDKICKVSESEQKGMPSTNIEIASNKVSEKQDEVPNEEAKVLESSSLDLPNLIIKTEVKQECVSSDDEIWIVQTGDEDNGQIREILEAAKVDQGDKNKCCTCSEKFSSQSQSEHKCRKTRKRKSDVGKTQNDEDGSKKAKKCKDSSSTPQIVTCHNCNKSFTSKVRLKFHMQFHEETSMLTGDGQYECSSCKCTFEGEAQLFDHVHFQHDNRHRWHCPVQGCGKTFYLRATLTKHSRTHTDTRRYVCVTCGKRFLDKQTLDEHGVTHLQIKPYQCHICLKQLTRVSRLRMHVRGHQQEPAPALLPACARCARAFRDVHDAQEHAKTSNECRMFLSKDIQPDPFVQLSPTSGLVRQTITVIESPEPKKRIKYEVSTPVAEPMLSKLSADARSLIRIVEIEKAFRCEYCEDVFYIEDGLNKHRAIHKGVKNPFICHICKVTFATYSRCTTHKTTHGLYKRPTCTDGTTAVIGYGDFPTVKHFLCEDCGRSYLHWTYLQVHRRMKHHNENCLHKCSQCDMTFPNSWSLAYHKKKLHTKLQPEESSKNVQNYRIPCRDCDEILPNKTALYKHRKKEHSGVSVQNLNINKNNTRNVVKSRIWPRPRPLTNIIEVQGIPTTEDIYDIVKQNNIAHEKIVDITTITIHKGMTSVVPNSLRALSMLSNLPRTRVPYRPRELHNYVTPYFNPERSIIKYALSTFDTTNANSMQTGTNPQNLTDNMLLQNSLYSNTLMIPQFDSVINNSNTH